MGKKPVPNRNIHASKARILERLMCVDGWVSADRALGPGTKNGPWQEDLVQLVLHGWVISQHPPTMMTPATLVRLPEMQVTLAS